MSALTQTEPYWERACEFFHGAGYTNSVGGYFTHHKREHVVRIGIMSHRRVALERGVLHRSGDGEPAVREAPSDGSVFKRIEERLDGDAPCFFLVSPDFMRPYADESLPQMIFMQPAIEFTFSPDAVDGRISYAADAAMEQQGEGALRETLDRALPSPWYDLPERPRPFSEIAAGWVPAEPDESFVSRLDRAVHLLADHPNGKMTLTRAYERRLATRRSPFELYKLHAGSNGEYAYSHFVRIREGVFSLGCTPENVFEIHDRTLSIDVVAATSKSAQGDHRSDRELLAPKQVSEHRGSLDHREGRYRSFCVPGSFRVTSEMQIIRLRHVCHLHSVITAELLPGITMFDVLGNVFPLIGARPKELLPFADSEPAPHRYYGGVIGHVNRNGSGCFLNLRNVLVKDGVLHAKVGVGIISESDAEDELVESREKISGVMEAVHAWDRVGDGGPGP